MHQSLRFLVLIIITTRAITSVALRRPFYVEVTHFFKSDSFVVRFEYVLVVKVEEYVPRLREARFV